MSIQELMKHAEITQRQQGSRRITQEQRERMERDAMAWQAAIAFAANSQMTSELCTDDIAVAAYVLADAFLAERKRQQGGSMSAQQWIFLASIVGLGVVCYLAGYFAGAIRGINIGERNVIIRVTDDDEECRK